MTDTVWVVFTENGVSRIAKRGRPALQRGEYALRLTLAVPETYFEEVTPVAVVTLTESGPQEATVTITDPYNRIFRQPA